MSQYEISLHLKFVNYFSCTHPISLAKEKKNKPQLCVFAQYVSYIDRFQNLIMIFMMVGIVLKSCSYN